MCYECRTPVDQQSESARCCRGEDGGEDGVDESKEQSANNQWEMRAKEYESRLEATEERVKREHRCNKERVAGLENRLKSAPLVYIFRL